MSLYPCVPLPSSIMVRSVSSPSNQVGLSECPVLSGLRASTRIHRHGVIGIYPRARLLWHSLVSVNRVRVLEEFLHGRRYQPRPPSSCISPRDLLRRRPGSVRVDLNTT